MSRSNDMRNSLNRKVCRNLISTMKKAGWIATKVDGESLVDMNLSEKVEEIHQVDGGFIRFEKGKFYHQVSYVPYNCGAECICDWGYLEGDADGFNKIMESLPDYQRDQDAYDRRRSAELSITRQYVEETIQLTDGRYVRAIYKRDDHTKTYPVFTGDAMEADKFMAALVA